MAAFQTTRLAVAMSIVLTATSCGPILYYAFPQTRTYEYERRVPIVVRSDPAGATIMTSDGTILGEAPMIVDAKVRVRRSHRSRNVRLLTLGCIIDSVASVFLIDYWFGRDFTHSLSNKPAGLARSLFDKSVGLAGVTLGVDCEAILINSAKRVLRTGSKGGLVGPIDMDERIIPNTLKLTARWDGLGDVHARLELPATRTSTLRFPRTYTFEEALILWARETAPPPTAENLYRVGDAYRILALRGVHGAMERAVGFFTRYLELYPAAEHASDVRRALEEFGPPRRHER